MIKKLLVGFSILIFFTFISTPNFSHAMVAGCYSKECENTKIGIAIVATIFIIGALLYASYSKSSPQSTRDQAFLREDVPLPVVNYVWPNQILKAENKLSSPNDLEQPVHEWGKFAIVRW